MSVEERLRAEDWGRIRMELTTYAWKRMAWANERKEDAEDIAQEAIARAFQRKGGWDPEAHPLRRYLQNRVASMVSNHVRLFRNQFEVSLRDDDAEEHDDEGHFIIESIGQADRDATDTQSLAAPGESLDEAIDGKRYAFRFRARLEARVAGDEIAMTVVGLMLEGVEGAVEQAAESTYTLAELRFARRRVFHHAQRITKELATERGAARSDVAQVEVSK